MAKKASYQIVRNGLVGGKSFHAGLLKAGISRFLVAFENSQGDVLQFEHEVYSTDPDEIDKQLKCALAEYEARSTSPAPADPDVELDVKKELA